MSIPDQYYRISEIIARTLTGQTDEAETAYLQQWLEASPENRKIYEDIRKATWYRHKKQLHREFNADKAWLKIWPKINSSRNPKVTPGKRLLFRYAAAAAVILVIAGVVFRTELGRLIPPREKQPVVIGNSIVPGQNTATLTLSSGEKLTLSQTGTNSIPHAVTNGREIIYDKNSGSREPVFNTLTIPRGGQFFMELADGTRIWLNSESQLRYPVAFGEGKPREITLIYGEAYFDVSPASAHKGTPFIVNHDLQHVEVLGTEFNIRAFRDEDAVYTTLVEGSVKISSDKDATVMQEGEQAVLRKSDNHLNLYMADVFREVSWKNGYFTFKDKSLAEIMKVLSRWYDMDVVFRNPSLKERKFNGTLHKKQSIEEVMEIMKHSFDTYEINNKTLIIK